MSKWYGNLTNRLEEGKNFTGREIKPGDDITMYYYSDRQCFYVTEVENQKRIKVRPWYTCADHEKEGGMGHQNWCYFRSVDERNEYLARFFPEDYSDKKHFEEPPEQVWVFRYNKWMKEYTHTTMDHPEYCTDREREAFKKQGFFKTYHNLNGRVSFGRRDYYHDWEF